MRDRKRLIIAEIVLKQDRRILYDGFLGRFAGKNYSKSTS